MRGIREGERDAASATNSQTDAAHELRVVQIVGSRPGGRGGDLLLLPRLRRVAVGGHPAPPPRFVWPPEGTGGIGCACELREEEKGTESRKRRGGTGDSATR